MNYPRNTNVKMKIHKVGAALATAGVLMAASFGSHAASMTFTLATSGTRAMRSVAMQESSRQWSLVLNFKAGYSGSLFAQGTELGRLVVGI